MSGSGSARSRRAIYVSADEAAVRAVDRSLAEAFPSLSLSWLVAPAPGDRTRDRARHLGRLVGIGYLVAPAASTYAHADDRREARVGCVRAGPRPSTGAARRSRWSWSMACRNGPTRSWWRRGRDRGVVDPTGGWLPIRARWGVVVET